MPAANAGSEIAPWERADPIVRRSRCVSCRRPEGLDVIAWRSGAYAVFVKGSLAACYADGSPVLTRAGYDALIADNDWRVVSVELDEEERCPRCAHLAARVYSPRRGPDLRPRP